MDSAPAFRRISAYGAAGGTGARNHLSRAHGVFISAVCSLRGGEPLYILVGQQGEDACPGVSRACGKGAVQAPQGEGAAEAGVLLGTETPALRGGGPARADSGARCPQGSPESRLVCLGESRAAEEHVATDGTEGVPGSRHWAGGGGGGGGATYVFRVRWGPKPLPAGAHTRALRMGLGVPISRGLAGPSPGAGSS